MNWKQAVSLGICSTGFYAGKEPAAYLYNGVRLPKLPVTNLQYAHIRISENSGASLELTSSPLFVVNLDFATNATHGCRSLSDGTHRQFRCAEGEDVWTEKDLGDRKDYTPGDSVFAFGSSAPFVWANYDVKDEDGTLHLEASNPIPVYA